MENFDLKKIKTLNYEQQKQYINKYLIPLTNGAHCRLHNGVYDIIDKQVLNDTYLNRCDKKLKTYYLTEIDDLKSPVYELGKPILYDGNINLCPQLPVYKPYKEFNENIKGKVNIFLEYIKEVLCTNNDDIYNYLLKWLSNMCKGNKNDCAIVLKTHAKGVGKSTLSTMMIDYVLGKELCLETGSEPIKSHFNSILGGKLFVSFEELETLSSAEWMAVDCRLKRQITSKKITLEKKGQDQFEATNINNYMLLSNHDVNDDDRRYFVLDVSTHRKGDRKYWSNIYDNCFNEEVGNALYSFLREINTDKFHPQDYPETKNKLKSISKRLDSVYSFLKDKYVLHKKDIDSKLLELYEEYKSYCSEIQKKPTNKTDFTSKLSEIQITYYKSNGYNKFKVSSVTLQDIANKNKWINDLDEFVENTSPFDDNIDYEPEPDYKKLYLELLAKQEVKKEKKNKKPIEPVDEDLEKELELLLKN